MVYSYLFEAKSIQAYLFQSGKLKDVIAASERLDKLIDSSERSTLFQVLTRAEIQSDILDPSLDDSPNLIRFLRCKGGAFYAVCQHKMPLLALRSLWSLTVQQLFPGLAFTDALTEASTLQEAITLGQRELVADRNAPCLKLPLASAVTARNPRTGGASVPSSNKQAAFTQEDQDLDISLHRQAYQVLDMRKQAALQDRFTPDSLQGSVAYPINLEDDFQYSAKGIHADNAQAIKDIALIHIDGNGLGVVLIALNEALRSKTDDEYRKGFRTFSDAISSATVNAAKTATQWLNDEGAYSYKAEGDRDARTYLPMRPLVLGGDDLTLLCRADLALEYSKRFCQAFEKSSLQALKPLFKNYLQQSNINPFLTASGGILYHKAGHPFTQSHPLVEELCLSAKKLTKSVNQSDREVDPAALAFFRQSKSVSEDFATLKMQTQRFDVRDNHQQFEIDLGLNAFFIEAEHASSSPTGKRTLASLAALAALSRSDQAPVSMVKWRQMASHLALGNKIEADRIYHRALENSEKQNSDRYKKNLAKMRELFNLLASPHKVDDWYWPVSTNERVNPNQKVSLQQSILADLLIIDHFRPVISRVNEPNKEVNP